MKKVKVFYWTNLRWIQYGMFSKPDKPPTEEDMETDYCKVLETEIEKPDSYDGEFLDYIFYILNWKPQRWIKERPFEVQHMSMSIGDIVSIDDKESYICCPTGWEKLNFVPV